jgi:hypothetical protein
MLPPNGTTVTTDYQGSITAPIAEIEAILRLKSGDFIRRRFHQQFASLLYYLQLTGLDLKDEAAVRGAKALADNPCWLPYEIDALVIAAKGYAAPVEQRCPAEM